ncbi:eukaryotic translation initiation factor 5A [Galendromus occidentalis]|uniref:Eukaryotic translation initiation factor 5A n=1 Tax=Galendromus occidentalis TaxID=34638 RepID=A0AAJ7P9E0_9ACAR|nr:eukaryotic translation initiation factor 5A [Galendromus occidentalis]
MADEESYCEITVCSSLCKDGFVNLHGRPCKIIELTQSDSGDVHIIGADIFNSERCEQVIPSTNTVQVPNIKRRDYKLVDIGRDGFVCMMNEEGTVIDDIRLPSDEDLANRLREDLKKDTPTLTITTVAANGKEMIVSCREGA